MLKFRYTLLIALSFFALSVASDSAPAFADEQTSFFEDFTGYSSPLNGNSEWSTSGAGWDVNDGAINVPATDPSGWQTALWQFSSVANFAEEGYFSFDFYADSSDNNESHTNFFHIYGITTGNMAKTNIRFGADSDSNEFKVYLSSSDSNPQSYAEDEWHTLKCYYWRNSETDKYDYIVQIDNNGWSDTATDSRAYSAINMNDFGIARYYQSSFKFDNIYVSDVVPEEAGGDPFEGGISYSGDYSYYLSYVSPSDPNFYNASFQGYDVVVKPDPDFSTLWYARFQNGYEEKTKITTKECDSDFQNCTAEILPNQTSFINSLADLSQIDLTGKSRANFNLDFNVVDDETRYYKIELWEGNLDNEAITLRHTIPLKITGDTDSTREDIDPVFPDGEIQQDLGFFGNLIRDLFLPDSDFISRNLDEINTIRLEKFVWYTQVKDELDSGVAVMASATETPPSININLYGSGNVDIFDTTAIDSYIPTFKSWMSAFLWVMFAIFLIKFTPNLLRS